MGTERAKAMHLDRRSPSASRTVNLLIPNTKGEEEGYASPYGSTLAKCGRRNQKAGEPTLKVGLPASSVC
jgi:hypothetical protein